MQKNGKRQIEYGDSLWAATSDFLHMVLIKTSTGFFHVEIIAAGTGSTVSVPAFSDERSNL